MWVSALSVPEPSSSDRSLLQQNSNWHICEAELRASASGPNLATDPTHAIQSSGVGAKAFDRMTNCTQWDGRMGADSDMWTPGSPQQKGQWVGYDFGTAQKIESIRIKQ